MQWLSPFVQLHPVARPTVGEGFLQFPAWRRSVSAILYCLLCFEHWVAPQGWIREWLRLNILATVLIGTAVLLTGPVVTALLHNLYEWADAIVKILIKVASMLSVLPPLILSIVAGLILWTLFRRRRSGQPRPHSNQQFYE